MDENAGLWLEFQIVESQPDQFEDAQSSREAKVEHSAIADAVGVVRYGRIQDGLHLFNREMSNQAGIGFLRRNRQNALYCGSDGRIEHVSSVTRDVSDVRKTEEERRRKVDDAAIAINRVTAYRLLTGRPLLAEMSQSRSKTL